MPSRLRGSLVSSAHWVVSSSCTVSALPVAWSITAPSVSLQLFSASRTTSDPLSLEGIGDPSAKYAAAAVNSCLNIVFNGIWSRQTDYFTAPNGVITLTGYGTAEGTQKYKIALWRKVDGGAQYVDGSTYYIKTDGQNYRCSIGGLDPAASYRLTISYDSSRYYLYGGLKVEGIAG